MNRNIWSFRLTRYPEIPELVARHLATWSSWEKQCFNADFNCFMYYLWKWHHCGRAGWGQEMYVYQHKSCYPSPPSDFSGGPLRWTHLHTTSKATSQKELNRCKESPNLYQLYQKVFLFEKIYLYNLKRCAIAALSGIFGNLLAKIIAIEESG